MYKISNSMEYIFADKSSLAVIDARTGIVHFFDEVGIDILNYLEEPCTLDKLIEYLCTIYDAAPNQIRDDVIDFLRQAIEIKVVEKYED